MAQFAWDPRKNEALKNERHVSFEDVLFHIAAGDVLDIFEHPNQLRSPGQWVYAIAMEGYVYLVPFVETDEEIFLKTIIPSRKAKKRYIR